MKKKRIMKPHEKRMHRRIVIHFIAVSQRQFSRMVANGEFPPPFDGFFWLERDVVAWMESRARRGQSNKEENMSEPKGWPKYTDRVLEPTFRFMRWEEVMEKTGLSKSQYDRLAAQGKLPYPVQISERRTVVRSDELARAMEALPRPNL